MFVTLVALLAGLVAVPAQAATPEQVQASVELGLPWLVAQQDVDGSWYGEGNYEVPTGLALLKLCERAYELNDPNIESPFDPDYAYSANVIAGFQWLFNQLAAHEISPQDHTTGASGTMDDPDSNSNGVGVVAQYNGYRETYSTAALLVAISASRTPNRPSESPMAYDAGATYGSVAQDMVDWFAFGQVEYPVPGITAEGGWEYFAMNNGAYGSGWMGDQSNSGYATLALAEAQNFGCTIPNWVKVELDAWISHIQAPDGGSYYSYAGDFIGENLLKTGNLISQMAFVGDSPATPRVMDALTYLENHWADPAGYYPNNGWLSSDWPVHASDYQTMFCLMKGLVYMGVDTFGAGPIDWFEDLSDRIIFEQDPGGGWLTYGTWEGGGSTVLSTVWSLLTLERIAPPPPIQIEVSKHWSYTNVCFALDNDMDGLVDEDPVDLIDNDLDGLVDEDPMECDEYSLGTPLPTDDTAYQLEAVVKKNGTVSSYNPGQFYAVSTVGVSTDVDELVITETYADVIISGLGELNPAKGGGKVVVVQMMDGTPVQIWTRKLLLTTPWLQLPSPM